MLISLNWLKKYVKIPVSDDELVRLIGARLVEVEGVIDESTKYNNIYIVRVETAEKIPDTHLTLCQINDGGAELVQVVCGAPNVREGMLTAWIKPGAIVPASVHEDAPFVIGKRKMLGKYDSNGMLAGADELDFGDDHSGIVEIDPEIAKPGDLLADVFELNDKILEIENKSLTHRPDCFGMIGFAREVAGILGQKFELDAESEFSILDPVRSRPSSRGSLSSNLQQQIRDTVSNTKIQIQIQDQNICKRYSALVLEKHGEIKKKYLTWQDTILAKSGMKPISPIVDATNYLMLLTGQPLHAFDYDKFVAVGGGKNPEIVVRLAKDGEKLTLLDEKQVELNENDIVICSGKVPVALAGAMGGKSTMIDENTKNIILESATFSLYNLRKTQMAHGIFSEAITRFTKGQPPYQTLDVANECARMLSDGFKVSAMADEYPTPEKGNVVKITTKEINQLLGTDYSGELIVKTLENVGFSISFFEDLPEVTTVREAGASATDERRLSVTMGRADACPRKTDIKNLEITSPLWRTDIHIKEDVIEEVGRLLGYDNIAPVLPLHGTASRNDMLELKTKLRQILSSFGCNEVLTYSFVSGKLLEKAGLDTKNSYKIVNSISPELQYIRQSIVPSLLDKTFVNQKIPFDKFALFEMNKVFQKNWGMNEENVPVEKMKLGFVLAERKNTETAYYKAKKFADSLFETLNIKVKYLPFNEKTPEAKPFEPKRSAEIRLAENEKILLGVIGEFKNSVKHNFKLADFLAGFELDLDEILIYKVDTKKVEIVNHRDTRDLTVTTEKTYAEIISNVEETLAQNNVVARITPISIYQPDDKKRVSLHLEFAQDVDDALMTKLEKLQ